MRSHSQAPSAGSIRTAGIAALILALALLAISSAPALAAPGHPLLRTFSTGPGSGPRSLATDSGGNVYVLDVYTQRIEKFDSAGNPVSFSGSAPYIADNSLTGTSAGPFDIAPWFESTIAVDRSGGPNDGYVYFAEINNGGYGETFVFDPTGTYKGKLGPGGQYGSIGVAVNQATGEVYVSDFSGGVVRRYPAPTGDPALVVPNAQLSVESPGILAADSSGAIYTGSTPIFGGAHPTRKFEASQFGASSPAPAAEYEPTNPTGLAIDPANGDLYADNGSQIIKRSAAGVQQGVPFGNLTASQGVTADGSGNVLVSDANGGVFVYGSNQVELPVASTGASANVTAKSAKVEGSADPDSAGTITSCEFRYGEDSGYSAGSVPCVPGGPIVSTTPVTADLTGLVSGTTYHYRLFLANANGTQAGADQTFTTPNAIEGVSTGPATAVKNDNAELNGSYTGTGLDTHYYFEWGRTTSYRHTTPAAPGNDAGNGTGTQKVAPVQISGLKAATSYHYRLVVSNASGITRGQDETLTTGPSVTNLTADPPLGITNHGAELAASFDADSRETHYYFEWGPTINYGNLTPAPPGNAVAPGSGRVHVPAVAISGLAEGSTYHFRVVATNSLGITVSPDRSFSSAESPGVGNLSTRNVTASSAELSGEINPHSSQTTYRFEWGNTTGYGNSIPVPDIAVGSGTSPVPVSAQLEGLASGATYHFRLVATNQYGTRRSVDQSFGFYPPNCPNAQARQETRSNNLPDCRAYELVTPSFAQGTIIFPHNGPNTGLATNPARLSYTGLFGVFPEETGEPINDAGEDLYISTRSDSGWYQKYIGLGGTQTLEMGAPPANWSLSAGYLALNQLGTQVSPGMDRVVDYNRGFAGPNGQRGKPSNAPYVWDSSTGKLLERWPTNLGQVDGGEGFVGVPQASADFSHFVFSSNVVFAPGGEHSDQQILCCWPWDSGNLKYPGFPKASVYDDDLATGSVVLASRKADGAPFQGMVFAVSDDGSHILMGEEAATVPNDEGTTIGPPAEVTGPIYLRVGSSHTYEIASGRHIRYIGSTADGTTIYLTSAEQLTADDHDSSTDLFVWHQSDPNTLTRVSTGSGGAGNSDACAATWVSKCGVGIISFYGYSRDYGGDGGNGVSDNFIASTSGDIYFESPEQLVEGKGEPDMVNLYLFRDGTVRFVTTMSTEHLCTEAGCSDGPVARMQVTPDGAHMAFVTNSRISAYDSGQFREMYTFDPASGQIACASCRRDGQPPVSDAWGSQNGLFQTNDGRAFFATEDPLVPRDTDETRDVYEYTEGKPQLISSGLGSKLEGNITIVESATKSGLVSVSANGTDVYFATLETLVTQDHNGLEPKIYDARTGGGFPAERSSLVCAAADECHGPGSTQPALPPDRTSASLGKPSAKARAHRKAHKHKKKAKHKKKQTRKAKKSKASNGKQGGKHHG